MYIYVGISEVYFFLLTLSMIIIHGHFCLNMVHFHCPKINLEYFFNRIYQLYFTHATYIHTHIQLYTHTHTYTYTILRDLTYTSKFKNFSKAQLRFMYLVLSERYIVQIQYDCILHIAVW